MTKKTLLALAAVLVLLGGIYYYLSSSGADRRQPRQVSLLEGIDADQVHGFSIEQGQQTIELKQKDGQWVLPSRDGYPANKQKVGSTLYKIFDLSSSQKVPGGEESLKKLSLDDEGVKEGKTHIRFFDGEGKELGGLYLGQMREGKTSSRGMPSMGGQYVRLQDSNQVFLVSTPVVVSTSATDWLDTNVVSIRQSRILSVEQMKKDAGEEALLFNIIREDPQTDRLVLKVPPEGDEEIQPAVMNQVAGGLENLRLMDVKKADDPQVAALAYDAQTVYRTDNALIYTVQTSQGQDQVFAKLSAALDENMAKELQKKLDEEKAKAEQEKAEKTAAGQKEGDKQEAAPSPADTPKPTVPPATSEEVTRGNEHYGKWVFVLAQYQGDKFRKGRGDLVKKKEEPKPAAGQEKPEGNGANQDFDSGMEAEE